MSVWGIVKNLKFREIATLSQIFIRNPRYFLPTLDATVETIKVCDFKFGDKHHLDNPTNAFRHAYWNYLICEKCNKVSGTPEKVAAWAQKITDLHEDLSPNEELEREMDLHNNRIGREIFLKYPRGIQEPEKFFKNLMAQAKQVKSLDQIKKTANQLVFIEN